MPDIVFDPPDEPPVMQGGALEGAKRAEYMELCKQMTSRNPSLNYPQIRDAIITILEEDVRGYIETLPEPDRASLIRDVDTIFSSIDRTDSNYIATINIVSFQISILFTQYIVIKRGIIGNVISNDTRGGFIDSYYSYSLITKNNNWKTYSVMKGILSNGSIQYTMLMNLDPLHEIFMAFIGFLRLGELLESYLNNVFYVGLSYTTEWVDGDYYLPLAYLSHDIFHHEGYSGSCPKFPIILNGFKQFREYVVTTKDAQTRYSIDFALFYLLHEHNCGEFEEDTLENIYQNKATRATIFDLLNAYIDELTDLQNFGKAIPKAYREMTSERELNEKKVNEYLKLVAERYVACWNEFREAILKSSKGGRRHQRKTRRRYHKKRATRKFRTRRS